MCFSLQSQPSVTEIYIAVGLMGAFMLGLYSQCIAHVNDHLEPSQIVAAAGALVLTYGIGYALSPMIIGTLLPWSAQSFFWVNGACAGGLGLFVLYRMLRRPALEDQGDYIPVSTASPYATVVSAAEEWSEDTTVVDSSLYDETTGREE